MSRSPAQVKRQVGVVTQHNTLDRSLRVGEVLYWHCRYFNWSRRDSRTRADELLERFELSDRGNERISALSGGLARRLQLAAAIAHQPALIVLDEPTTGLDADARHALWDHVRDLAGQRACVLLTTHYLEEADALASRLVVIDHGRVIAQGAPDQLRDRVGADTLIEAVLEHPERAHSRALSSIAGVTHIARDAQRLRIFARHRAGLIADTSTPLLAAGLRDLTITKPSLEQVISALIHTQPSDPTTRNP